MLHQTIILDLDSWCNLSLVQIATLWRFVKLNVKFTKIFIFHSFGKNYIYINCNQSTFNIMGLEKKLFKLPNYKGEIHATSFWLYIYYLTVNVCYTVFVFRELNTRFFGSPYVYLCIKTKTYMAKSGIKNGYFTRDSFRLKFNNIPELGAILLTRCMTNYS